MVRNLKKEKIYERILFIFRRDLRLSDNTALIKAQKLAHQVIPCFIFDPNQIGIHNQYRSLKAIQFMIGCLLDLQKQLNNDTLHFFYGEPFQVVLKILKSEKIDAIFVNEDYTPYSKYRDAKIMDVCSKYGVKFASFHDILLTQPEEIKTKKDQPYKVFTQYFNQVKHRKLNTPIRLKSLTCYNQKISDEIEISLIAKMLKLKDYNLHFIPKRTAGLQILNNLSKFKNYNIQKNFLDYSTTMLSPYIKFGVLSIREVAQAINKILGYQHELMRQTYWHDFFTYIAYHFPHVFGNPFYSKYTKLTWDNDIKMFKLWCEGRTGFPIVDAGMRQLNSMGYMHNRCRLITASFLVKDLHIDWRWGEKYFAQKLIDYDPAINNGNWQWVASTGCDKQPYFRIFNPWLQQKKFDKDCKYIKRWVVELQNVENKLIHNWFKQEKMINDYPLPIVNHKQEANKAKMQFKIVNRKT